MEQNGSAKNVRFAVISDPHIALPHTVWDHTNRFHLVEVSIPALEVALSHLGQLDLDFLLMPGDLTQHGEPENHTWLADRLAQLPFPVYVIPGNHDVPVALSNGYSIGLNDFPRYYHKFGYKNPDQLYYTCEVLPGIQLIGLNSNQFNQQGEQQGYLDLPQLRWLEHVLADVDQELVLVMVHHNILEHLPGQIRNPIGRRYMLQNASALLDVLQRADVQLVFTGHLHVQQIAHAHDVYDITTGSLVSYPHPYRVLQLQTDAQGRRRLQIESHQVQAVPDWPQLQQTSREWMGDRSFRFMLQLLTQPPLNLPLTEAKGLAPDLRYFWAAIAAGDPTFHFPHFPEPVRRYFESFSAHSSKASTSAPADNDTTLLL